MIIRKQRKNGSFYYQSTITGKITAKKDYFSQENRIFISDNLPTNLTKKEKLSLAASNRIRIDNKFISKREEKFFKELLKEKGIEIKGNELKNIIPLNELKDIRQARKGTKETVSKYTKGYDKKSKSRVVVFDIFDELNSSFKEGRKFQIDGKEVNFSQAIKAVTNFTTQKTAGMKNPPLFIWRFEFLQDGDIINILLEETEVIESK